MKRKLLLLMLVLSLGLTMMFACGSGKPSDEPETPGGPEEPEKKENLIYDSKSELYFIQGSNLMMTDGTNEWLVIERFDPGVSVSLSVGCNVGAYC